MNANGRQFRTSLPANHANSREQIRYSSIRFYLRHPRANLLCFLFVSIRVGSRLEFR